MTAELHRPTPVLDHSAEPVDRGVPPGRAAAGLLDGATLIVTDHYNTALKIQTQLETQLGRPSEHADYGQRRAYRRALREASLRLLVPIARHRLDLDDPPTIGFLDQLYPDHASFALPFIDIQALNSAWNLYNKGVHLAVLGHRVHPFYGTYAPTRTSHLELFATWLSKYEGERRLAIDVGTGCGVLAMMLCKAGFDRVVATDNNPNAIESVARDRARRQAPWPLELVHGDLLGDDTTPADLVVFNPPWTQGEVDGLLDSALYYEEGLFDRFFDQAHARITDGGRVVLLFSNLIELVQPDVPHPILAELARGRFELVQRATRKVKPVAGPGGRKRRTREKVEVWELAKVVSP